MAKFDYAKVTQALRRMAELDAIIDPVCDELELDDPRVVEYRDLISFAGPACEELVDLMVKADLLRITMIHTDERGAYNRERLADRNYATSDFDVDSSFLDGGIVLAVGDWAGGCYTEAKSAESRRSVKVTKVCKTCGRAVDSDHHRNFCVQSLN